MEAVQRRQPPSAVTAACLCATTTSDCVAVQFSIVSSHRRPSEVMVHCFLPLDGCDHFLGASDSL